jgi:hypothetical protein
MVGGIEVREGTRTSVIGLIFWEGRGNRVKRKKKKKKKTTISQNGPD